MKCLNPFQIKIPYNTQEFLEKFVKKTLIHKGHQLGFFYLNKKFFFSKYSLNATFRN